MGKLEIALDEYAKRKHLTMKKKFIFGAHGYFLIFLDEDNPILFKHYLSIREHQNSIDIGYWKGGKWLRFDFPYQDAVKLFDEKIFKIL